jgi:hypothetical protein
MTAVTAPRHHKSHAPKARERRIHVAMHMSPEEKTELEALAAREERSLSSLARLLYLKGLDIYKLEEQSTEQGSGPARPAILRFVQSK